jgi:succinate dehydrogenase/fumarate reductase flavoprotein subunit
MTPYRPHGWPDAVVECDVLVAGAGAGGLSAAVTARLHGLDVLVAEKTDCFGGTTARSGGGLWIPGSPLAQRAGLADSTAAARRYMAYHAGPVDAAALIDAYLQHGPAMVEFFQQRTAVRFVLQKTMPDYHLDLDGSVLRGRTIYAAPFHAAALGAYSAQLASPLPELTFLGMGIARTDLQHFFRTTRSPRSAAFVGRRLLTHLVDLARHGRTMHLVNGQALAARLLKSAIDAGVRLWAAAPIVELTICDGTVTGARIEYDGTVRDVVARRGVVLACGGLGHDHARQAALYPHVRAGAAHWSLSPQGNTGDGLRLGEDAGGRVANYPNAGYWTPVSLVPRGKRGHGVFPHTNGLDRSKPGFICVARSGARFVCECTTYHEFVQAMFRHPGRNGEPEAFVICDHSAIRRYGLGAARPFPVRLAPHLRSGYIVSADTIGELARCLDLDAAALAGTVEAFNASAGQGRDPQFGKGSDAYHWYQGDPDHRPNPCLAPLRNPPFYALRLVVGDVGTFAGLKTDGNARVLSAAGLPLEGLYAVGNDMANLCGGHTPGAGITLGPAMTFGYIAGRHLATRQPARRARDVLLPARSPVRD